MVKATGRTKVHCADTAHGARSAVRECLDAFGGAASLLKRSGDVFIKVNAVDLKPYSYTDPEVIRETVSAFRDGGARNVYVMENCTQSNFTRIVFHSTGIARACRESGAVPVYLDETDSVPLFLEGIEEFVDISSFVYRNLVERADANLYVSLPKLKTHSMSGVTLSIKNQFGFVHQASRISDHNYRLHRKFSDIYRALRPDFSLIDGLIATNHGHYIAEGNAERCVVQVGLLVAGPDPLAVDAVGAALMGYRVSDVEHLRLSALEKIGIGDMKRIDIGNRKLFEARKVKLTHELLDDFPADLRILRGSERCCAEGCRRNTETVVEVLHRDHGGRGGFTIVMGKGVPKEEIDAIQGRVHLAGSCAAGEHCLALVERLGEKNVTVSEGCNNLAATVHGLCRHMGVSPLKLVPVNPLVSLSLLARARLKGSRAIIPPLL